MRGVKQEVFEISDLRRRVRSVYPFVPLRVCVCGGGGVTLIFSCIRRLWLFLGVQNFDFFFWGGGERGGLDDLVDIFWGHRTIELYLEVISMHFRVFSEGQGTEWRIFFGLLKRQIFIWGA